MRNNVIDSEGCDEAFRNYEAKQRKSTAGAQTLGSTRYSFFAAGYRAGQTILELNMTDVDFRNQQICELAQEMYVKNYDLMETADSNAEISISRAQVFVDTLNHWLTRDKES